MSHNVIIQDIKIADLSVLASSVEALKRQGVNIELDCGKGPRSVTFRTYEGEDNRADAVIKLPNEAYDIGLIKNKDGAYVPIYDASMMRSNQSISCSWSYNDRANADKAGIGRLMQEYGCQVAEIEAARNSQTSRRVAERDGSINVVIEVA